MIIHYIKQGTPEWLALRVKKVTGTTLSKVEGAKWMEYADVIVQERITGKRKDNGFKSFSMDNGTILEPFNIAAYEECMGVKTTQVGFIQSSYFPDFGMSPDRLIFDSDIAVGCVEAKCPEPQTHIRYIRHGKVPAEYDDQILSAFVIGDTIQYVDFVSFCPLIKTYPLFIKRVKRSEYEKKIASARGSLIQFFKQVDELEALILKGGGFIPSNLEEALWEISDPEDNADTAPYAEQTEPDTAGHESDTWEHFVVPPEEFTMYRTPWTGYHGYDTMDSTPSPAHTPASDMDQIL